MIFFIFGILALLTGIICMFFISEHRGISLALGVIISIILIFCACISYIPTGYSGIITTFGKVHEDVILDAGINFHSPWDTVITMDNREQRNSFSLEAFSKDIQQVDLQGSINYNIDKSTAMNLYRDVGVNYVSILINPRIQEDVKIIIAKYTAENLIINRQTMSDEIYTLIKEELSNKGINIISLAIENIDFTDAFEAAVEAKQVATQEKQKAQTEQERKTMEEEAAAKRAIIVEEAKAEQAIIAANADLEVVKIQAEASLYAGQREAEMNQRISEALTPDLINYYWIKQWDGKLPTVSTDTMIPILNMGEIEDDG